ncbi:adhesion G protein-coupled receptor E2-like [Amphibalanus amphitrite]|uniref:adhesion G protein-coupled receptor E2-like n=1 Tax=Amphibalanus amphitrite TaxID=1232801 RepID=UPI001C90D49D|nr:adhesion G protein-coupled receptor E2-like [Amphibalanus amphitrite]
MMMFFAAPLVALMVVNVALFCGSAIIIRRTSQATVNTASSKTNLRLYTRLALITGMSWVIGLVAGWLHFPPLWYIFIVLDTLQGVFIFVSFTLTQRVRRDVERELSRYSAKRRCSRQSLRSSREKNTVKRGVEGVRCERALRGYVNTAVSESLPGCEGASDIVRVSVVDPVFVVKEEMQEENLENGENGM